MKCNQIEKVFVRRMRRSLSPLLLLTGVLACSTSSSTPSSSGEPASPAHEYEVLYAHAHSTEAQTQAQPAAYGSYGEPDASVRAITIDLPEGPFVAGRAIVGSCTARDVRGVPTHANVTWALHRHSSSPNALRRKSRPTSADGFSITETGLIARQAGSFELVCEQRNAQGAVLLRSPVRLVVVEPAEAVRWRVELSEQGPCVDQGRRLPVTWDAWDQFGNATRELTVSLETSPSSVVQRDQSDGFQLMEEGTFDLTFSAVTKSGTTLPSMHRRVIVDSTPPTIELLSPSRGEMVESSDYNVILKGRIVDAKHSITKFELEGVPQPLDRGPDGKGAQQVVGSGPRIHEFELPYKARWGLNVVHATVSDACNNSRSLLQSFLMSESFAPLRTEEHEGNSVIVDSLPGAVRATLHEHLWDHNDRSSEHDLRHLVEIAIANGGLNERLPKHLASWPHSHSAPAGPSTGKTDPTDHDTHDDFGIDIVRNGPLKMRAPEVESLRLEDGGFSMRLVMQDIELPIAIEAVAMHHFAPIEATLHAERLEIAASAHIFMGADGPVVEVCDSCVTTQFGGSGPQISLHREQPATHIWQRVGDNTLEWVLQQGLRGLTDGLRARVRSDMSEQIGRMLRGLKLQHALNLPKPLRGGLLVESGLDRLTLERDEQGASCAIDMYSNAEAPLHRERPRNMTPGQEPLTHGPIRSPLRPRHTPSLSSDGSTFALSVSDDLLNQMMWSMWASGAFNSTDLREVQQAAHDEADNAADRNLLQAAQITFYFMTPPVIMPSPHADELRLSVGDVYAEISIDLYKLNGIPHPQGYRELAATGYFSIGMRAKLGVDPEARALKIVKFERSHAQVHVEKSPSAIGYPAVTHWLEKMVRLTMPQHLKHAMTMSVPLPNIQIGHLPGVPKDAAWALEDVSLKRPPSAQETILQGRLGPLPALVSQPVELGDDHL